MSCEAVPITQEPLVPQEFDARWRRSALAGDGRAVAELARRMLRPLYRFCFYRVGGDRHLAEDVVQETFVCAIRELEKYEPDRAAGNIFPWLTGLARNEIRRVLKHVRNAQSLEQLWLRMDRDLLRIYAKLADEPFGDELLARQETQQMVNVTMSQLPGRYREALEAKYVDGDSVQTMAQRQGATEKAIESLLTRARRAFRETFLALTKNLEVE